LSNPDNTIQSQYKEFICEENFLLAWERVRYFDRPDSRDWLDLKIFAANREHNIEILRQSVIDRVFEPSWPEIKYIPKKSLTLRPMAMLAVTDRIVLQAIGNVIASRGRPRLAVVSNKQSFANVLTERGQKPLFSKWKRQYRLFQDKYLKLVEEGNLWVAETDATAFYETIEHEYLLKALVDIEFIDDEIAIRLRSYLSVWSSVRHGQYVTRGIPQDCLTSDLLANVFLYELDREFATKDYYYLRYVDDIRLLGVTKESVQRGLISLDMSIKSLGLLLQTKKTIIREVKDLSAESDRLADQLSDIDRRFADSLKYSDDGLPDPILAVPINDLAAIADNDEITNLDADELHGISDLFEPNDDVQPPFAKLIAEIYQEGLEELQRDIQEIYWQSLKNLDNADFPFAERHLKFALYRLNPNPAITKAVLSVYVDRPWLSQVIAHYLRKIENDSYLVDFLKNVISTHNVYDSIVALAIELLMQKGISLREFGVMFKRWILDGEKQWYLQEACILALGEYDDNQSALLKCFDSPSSTVRRMSLIQSLRQAGNQDEALYIASQAVTDPSSDVTNTLVYLLYNEWGLSIAKLKSTNVSIPEHCLIYAKGYDSSLPDIQADYIRLILRKRYSVTFTVELDFKLLLGTSYKRAADFLWQSENSYLSNPSRYVSQLDLFHETLLFPLLVDKLAAKSSYQELTNVELTNRIEMLGNKEPRLTTFVGSIKECRRLRANPETHSRFHRQLTYTNPITWQQRNALKRRLIGGYQELTQWLEEDSL